MGFFDKIQDFIDTSGEDNTLDRLEQFAGRKTAVTLEEIELSLPFTERILRPILVQMAERLSKLSPEKSRAAAEKMMEMGGKPYGWGAKEFTGMRFVAAAIFGVIAFILTVMSPDNAVYSPLAGLGGAVLGFFIPLLWIRSKIQARQGLVIKQLPDAMDLLTITVEAGMGFDGALQKVADKWDNEISRAFGRVTQEMRLGIARRVALKNMSDNIDVPDMTSLTAAIIQAEQLGVSIAKVLRVQSKQMRLKRSQRAEAEANKAPIKMLFPMVFLIFPALFIVLLAPAVLIILETKGLSPLQ
jgi:tight adherence protein C